MRRRLKHQVNQQMLAIAKRTERTKANSSHFANKLIVYVVVAFARWS